MKPGETTAGRQVPSHIVAPPYSQSMQPTAPPKEAEIQDNNTIQTIRQSCQLARYILDTVASSLKVPIILRTVPVC